MKSLLLVLSILITLAACKSNQSSKPMDLAASGNHKVIIKEVIQVGSYTYLFVSENNADQWLATPPVAAKEGDTYYYEGGFEMTNFKSKELDRVFEKILFVEEISPEPIAPKTSEDMISPGASVIKEGKKDIKITPDEGGIQIEELYNNKELYSGKPVKVKGEVVKFSPEIMGTNWIHIQDGTEYDGRFDFTITSDTEVKVGDIVSFEGNISINKDLGYGYFFEVMMEDAKLIK